MKGGWWHGGIWREHGEAVTHSFYRDPRSFWFQIPSWDLAKHTISLHFTPCSLQILCQSTHSDTWPWHWKPSFLSLYENVPHQGGFSISTMIGLCTEEWRHEPSLFTSYDALGHTLQPIKIKITPFSRICVMRKVHKHRNSDSISCVISRFYLSKFCAVGITRFLLSVKIWVVINNVCFWILYLNSPRRPTYLLRLYPDRLCVYH